MYLIFEHSSNKEEVQYGRNQMMFDFHWNVHWSIPRHNAIQSLFLTCLVSSVQDSARLDFIVGAYMGNFSKRAEACGSLQ